MVRPLAALLASLGLTLGCNVIPTIIGPFQRCSGMIPVTPQCVFPCRLPQHFNSSLLRLQANNASLALLLPGTAVSAMRMHTAYNNNSSEKHHNIGR
jgi:hypothetical protein